MELEYIQKNVIDDFDKLKQAIVSGRPVFDYTTAISEYEPSTHKVVTDRIMRPDKIINVGTDEKPESKTVFATRLAFPYQKKIVAMRAAFLCGNPVELNANPKDDTQKDLLSVIKKTWEDNKMDYKNKQILEILMSEMEVAVLWYSMPADDDYWAETPNEGKAEFKFKMIILANSKGDSLYPVFDDYGDMISFGREYVTLDNEGKKIYHFDLYTADNIHYSTSKIGLWSIDKSEKNTFGKIPIIYVSQPVPEWADVEQIINQYEISISDHTDTNAYNLDPTKVVEGHVIGFSQKGEKGSVLEINPGAKVSLLEWNQATDSRALEQSNLRRHIMDDTSTPDLSFEAMKGLGNYSYIALRMFFLSAHMAAAKKEEIYGEFMQRMINLLKVVHSLINTDLKKARVMKITPKFDYFMPKNEAEYVDLLRAANGGQAIMSQESTVLLNPLVQDYVTEQQRIKDEKQSELNNPNNVP